MQKMPRAIYLAWVQACRGLHEHVHAHKRTSGLATVYMCLWAVQGKVTVKAYPDKGARHLVIKVVDQGCGIPRDKLLTIFEAFKQVCRPAAYALMLPPRVVWCT